MYILLQLLLLDAFRKKQNRKTPVISVMFTFRQNSSQSAGLLSILFLFD